MEGDRNLSLKGFKMTELANKILTKSGTPGHMYLRKEEAENLERDHAAETERIQHAKIFKVTTANIGEAYNNQKRINERLERERVPDLDGETKDILSKEIEAIEGKIKHGMPTDSTMRRNEVGAVHHHITWETHNKSRIQKWKNLKKVLENDSEDPDLCNVERLRPSIVAPGGTSTFAADAQIGGHVALPEYAKDGAPEFMQKIPEGSGLGQIVAAEAKEASATGMPQVERVTATGRIVKQPAYEARECECGCSKMFIPKRANGRFASPTCRSRFHSRQQAEKKSKVKTLEV